MRYKGFVGGTYSGRSSTPASDRTINFYPESTSGAGSPEAEYVLLSTPGSSLFASLPTLPVQAVYTEPNTERVFAVAGSTLYELTSTGTYTTISVLETGPYYFASIGTQMMIACAGTGNAYIYTLATSVLVKITSGGFLGAAQVAATDSYFIVRKPNSRQIQTCSPGDGLTWDATDIAFTEGGADNLAGMLVDHSELVLFGTQHGEVYQDTGAVFPFERIKALYLEHGVVATDTLVRADNTFCWLGKSNQGQCRVFKSNGYQPVGISTRAVEWYFSQYAKTGSISDATAYAYQNESGHTFYVISFPSATYDGTTGVIKGATWVYDFAENLWHERASLTNGVLGAHVGRYHTFAFGKHLVCGGDTTGNIYALDETVYQDNGKPIKRIRRAPHLVDELKVISYPKFRLSAQVGVGPVGDPNNVMVMRFSNDAGMTWSNERQKPLGDVGNYETILEWRMLGRGTRRCFEASTTINAPVCLVDAFLPVNEGTK